MSLNNIQRERSWTQYIIIYMIILLREERDYYYKLGNRKKNGKDKRKLARRY